MPIATEDMSASTNKREYQSIPVTAIDNCFLVCEEEELPMTISCVWQFNTKLTREEVRDTSKTFNEKIEYRRYTQIITGDPEKGTAHWTDFDGYDVENHVFEHDFKGQKTLTEAKEFIGGLLSKPLSRDKPLWDAHLLNGIKDESGSTLVYRLHHAITDGQGSIRALLSVSSFEKDLASQQYNASKNAKPILKKRDEIRKAASIREKIDVAYKLAQKTIFNIMYVVYCLFMAFYDFFVLSVRPKRAFKNDAPHPEGKKDAAWTKGLDLDDVKIVKNAFGVTVNDVLLGCATGSLRKYMVEENEPMQELTCGIPFSMRSQDDWSLSNNATMAFTFLPVTVEDPLKRMKLINRRMNTLKLSPMPQIIYTSLGFLWNNPLYIKFVTSFDRIMLKMGRENLQTVLTNVPGPSQALLVAGHKLESYVPFIPQVNRSSIGMGVMSYDNKVFFGVFSELNNIKGGTSRVCDNFDAEFQYLLEAAKAKSQ
eukprot:Awhi_evm1s10695